MMKRITRPWRNNLTEGTISPQTPLSACIRRSTPTFCEAHGAPTTLTFNLPITGLVVVSASDHNAVTGAIAAQKYQELSLRLQKTLSSSSSGSHRDPTVPFWSIIDQSI